jgi:RNA 2',3'-cyclic 3'-phosphodiesterase
MPRAFVGIGVPIELARELYQRAVPALARTQRTLSPEELHLTLCFLGEVADAELERLAGALAPALAALETPRISLAGTGAFPRRGSERIAWAGIYVDPAEQQRLWKVQATVHAVARSTGLSFEDARVGPDWTPHVTLARTGPGFQVADAFYELDFALTFEASAVALFESHPGRAGSERYPVRRQFALRPRTSFSAPG